MTIDLIQVGTVLGAIVGILTSVAYIKKEITKPFTKRLDSIDNRLGGIESDIKIQKKGELNILRQSLLKSCEDYLKVGSITVDQLESMSNSYESYTELGGDSFITDLVKRCKELPPK